MPLDRVPGEDDLYIGSAFVLRNQQMLDNHGITHVLSVWNSMPADRHHLGSRKRLVIDVDDVEEEDLVVHLPRCVRFIEEGLQSKHREEATAESKEQEGDEGGKDNEKRDDTDSRERNGAVYVHCAMGKSRSASAVLAFLLWKYPGQFGGSGSGSDDPTRTYPAEEADEAVQRALALLRQSREVVEPNDGFMKQLALWWRMGCPAETEDAVEQNPMYQRWLYEKDVVESGRMGRAPDRLWFRDEDGLESNEGQGTSASSNSASQKQSYTLRCKKCRRALASEPFVVAHKPENPRPEQNCPHYFVEPLSWMRPLLEDGALEGRLLCPNERCGASLGRFAWQGFQCSCFEWVCPAFSLQRSKVDRVALVAAGDRGRAAAALGIRLPPGGGGGLQRARNGSTSGNL